jgi:hypothetical protein
MDSVEIPPPAKRPWIPAGDQPGAQAAPIPQFGVALNQTSDIHLSKNKRRTAFPSRPTGKRLLQFLTVAASDPRHYTPMFCKCSVNNLSFFAIFATVAKQ